MSYTELYIHDACFKTLTKRLKTKQNKQTYALVVFCCNSNYRNVTFKHTARRNGWRILHARGAPKSYVLLHLLLICPTSRCREITGGYC